VVDYQESILYLYALQKHGIKFGLNRTENLLERVGNPHLGLRCIHVGGTNGKGSTAAMLSSLLRHHGFRVGLYTSPHLVRFTERFRIDDQEVAPARILAAFEDILRTLDPGEPPTFFEMVTAMGLLYFAQEAVDWAVIEVGMGGRLDATNVIQPRVSVITNVSLEHQEYLGTTLSAIAREKAGIIKDGVPLVAGVRQPSALGVLKTACFRHAAPLYRLGVDFRARHNADGSLCYLGLQHRFPTLHLKLEGSHQLGNAALALAACELLEGQGEVLLEAEATQQGLLQVHWPARLEVLQEHPLMVLDGAHNAHGAESLREALKRCFSYERLYLVIGIMEDKDLRGILRRLLPIAHGAVFTKPRYERAAPPERLKTLARPYLAECHVIPDVAAAIEQARRMAQPGDLICVTGSLYFAGEVKELFGERPLFGPQEAHEPPDAMPRA
jgi:dihydrofolate synthase/folylpolyglutamate synthase